MSIKARFEFCQVNTLRSRTAIIEKVNNYAGLRRAIRHETCCHIYLLHSSKLCRIYCNIVNYYNSIGEKTRSKWTARTPTETKASNSSGDNLTSVNYSVDTEDDYVVYTYAMAENATPYERFS